VIAHDRRGQWRSEQSWNGNDMDTYADDLAALTQALNPENAVNVGHSTGGGEVARYIGRHGTEARREGRPRRRRYPIDAQDAGECRRLPMETFDTIRKSVLSDRSQFYRDLSESFYGANRAGSAVSGGLREHFWLQGMTVGLKAAHDCVKAFSETDLTDDLKKMDLPTLFVHRDDDQIVPFADSVEIASKIVSGSILKVYSDAPHRLTARTGIVLTVIYLDS